jgi:asparagine synthase (glutamine-hydrolysing)
MCGIAGFSGRYPAGLLKRMGDSISHRGPDDEGFHLVEAEGIGLAHRRLSIIDLSPSGHQPMSDADNRAVIVFNGEIYNYRELRTELLSAGFEFRGESDTEVLLNLYLRDGEAMLPKLNGIFCFAIWDSKRRLMFIARDGVGVKPLYYSQSEKGFLFASEMKALLEDPDLGNTLDPEAIHQYLSYLWCPAPSTMLKEVKKIEPGYAYTVQDGSITRKWCFYDLPYGQNELKINETEAAELVAETIAKAVERQMVADVPIGAFLSGGLDSSSVVAFAKRNTTKGRLQCFTIGFSEEAASRENFGQDAEYAKKVAKHLDVDLHTVRVGPEMAGNLEKMIWLLDEPQADPAPINALMISAMARDHGIKVLLSGAGGDDIFTGYRRHFALQQERYWSWLSKGSRRALGDIAGSISHKNSLGRRIAKGLKYAGDDGDTRLCSYFLWSDPDDLKKLYGPLMLESVAGLNALEPLVRSLQRIPSVKEPLNRMLYLEGKHFLADHNLNYTDRMSMAVGVEVRVPLLDPDLIALAASLPISMKQKGGEGKWIFKKAMEPYLPHNVIYRPKMGFGVPLRHWLRNDLRPMVDEYLSEASLRKRGIFDFKAVDSLRKADSNGRTDATYTIFSILCIEMWCRIFLDERRRTMPTRGMDAATYLSRA